MEKENAMATRDQADVERREFLAQVMGVTLIGAAAWSSGASAGMHTTAGLGPDGKPNYPPADPVLLAEINAVLKRTEEIWALQEWWRLPQEIWDREDPTPMYIAEELRYVMIGWDVLDRYMAPPKKLMAAFRWGYSNLWVKALAPGVTLALYDHWFEIKVRAEGPASVPRAGFDRVLSIYNLRDDGWRQSLYAQCPLGPSTYVEAMTEKLVKPDFDEFYENIQSRELNDPRLRDTGD